MRFTYFTDYSFRVLIYLGLYPDRLVSIGEISKAYGVSRNHVVKVVHHLVKHGFVASTRGCGGGLRLARAPRAINLRDVVRATEPDFDLVECFNRSDSRCRIAPSCGLAPVLVEALGAFHQVLGSYDLGDVLARSTSVTKRLGRPARHQTA